MLKRKSFAVIGLGRFGMNVAMELSKAGAYVLAIDKDKDKIQEIKDFVTCAKQIDVSDVNAMSDQGLSNMDCVVISIGADLDASVMATIIAKEENVPYIVAKSSSAIHSKILTKLGVDKTIIPEKEASVRLARNLLSSNFKEFIELSDKISMIEVEVKPEWVGKNLKQLDLRQKYNINVIAMRKDNEIIPSLNPDEPLSAGSTLLIIADRSKISKLV